VFKKIGAELRNLADEYRRNRGGVQPSTKKAARQRITKLNRAIAALEDQGLLKEVAADLGDTYNPNYVKDVIDRFKEEIARLEEIINWKPEQKKGSGYGLLSGLGYDEGYGYFY
jgi:hypothetical protein